MRNVTLYIPGLLGFHKNDLYPDYSPPTTLTSVLNHSNGTALTEASYCRRLANLFGLQLKENENFPAAAISRLIDDAERPQGFWMRADPVYLSADPNGMTLFDNTRLCLERHEALALGAKLQELFARHRFRLEVPDPGRWYVNLPHEPMLKTQDLDQVRGKSILDDMPQGMDRDLWLQLMNEIQMQLHDCDINQVRERSGKLPVNSLWFWGSGPLPDILPRIWSTVYSDDPLVQGLCMLSGTTHRAVDDFFTGATENDQPGEVLVIVNTARECCDYQDVPVWHDCISRLESDWMAPLVNQVQLNRIKSLTLITNNRKFSYGKLALLKFWKGFGKFADYLLSN